LDAIESEPASHEFLNAIAADYGQSDEQLEAINPEKLEWPVKCLPRYLTMPQGFTKPGLSLGATLAADAKVKWCDLGFIKGSPVTAAIEGRELHIVAQAITGRLEPRYGSFEALSPVSDAALRLGFNSAPKLLANALVNSLLPIEFAVFSERSQLTPLLFALFAIARPRRYVELGVRNGMSFFAACQVSERVQSNTECVAIDSWTGVPHGSFHSSTEFEEFKQRLMKVDPDAYYIQGLPTHAVNCFENGSVDLLNIKGYHTYDGVKAAFDSWSSKMSDVGIILFHDTNNHKSDCGVWQLWHQLRDSYGGLSFKHSNGLGLLYVGRQDSAIGDCFRWLKENLTYFDVIQRYFEVLGERSVAYEMKCDEVISLERSNGQRKLAELRRESDHEIMELSARIKQLSPSSEQIVIPVNKELGNYADYVVVIAKALRRLTYALRIRRFLTWPLRSRRRRYRKQLSISKYLRRHIHPS
jgi:hypothetical protein